MNEDRVCWSNWNEIYEAEKRIDRMSAFFEGVATEDIPTEMTYQDIKSAVDDITTFTLAKLLEPK